MSGSGFKGLDLSGKVAIVTGASRYGSPQEEEVKNETHAKYPPLLRVHIVSDTLLFTRGLGAGIAVLLAKRGANIVVNYVSDGSKERAEKVAKEVEASGSKAVVVKADVSKTEEIPKLVEAALKISTTGKIEILIHK